MSETTWLFPPPALSPGKISTFSTSRGQGLSPEKALIPGDVLNHEFIAYFVLSPTPLGAETVVPKAVKPRG